jgi:hypothetical protein
MTKPPLRNARNSKAEQNGLQPRRGKEGSKPFLCRIGLSKKTGWPLRTPDDWVQVDEIDCPEFRTKSGLTQKNLQAGSCQPRDADAPAQNVTKNSNCDTLDWQGMKPLHTSMIVKRLQLTIPFRDRTRSNFAHQQSERAWLNHHDAIRRSSRMP